MTTLTMLCEKAESSENLTIMGMEQLDNASRQFLMTAVKNVGPSQPAGNSLRLTLPEGCANRVAQTLRSLFSVRGIAIRVA